MKSIAILSDVHANLPALEATLENLARRQTPIGTYHLGDLVGYAPWPNEVVALLREQGIPGVQGNYDSTLATRYEHCGCGYTDPKDVELAHLSYSWTLEHTSEDLACCLLLHLPATEDQGKLEPHNLAGKPALLHLDQPLLREEPVFLGQSHGVSFIVAHEKEQQALISHMIPQAGCDMVPKRSVQGRKRFVQEEDLRSGQKGPAKGHPLLLAAGQTSRPSFQEVVNHKSFCNLSLIHI